MSVVLQVSYVNMYLRSNCLHLPTQVHDDMVHDNQTRIKTTAVPFNTHPAAITNPSKCGARGWRQLATIEQHSRAILMRSAFNRTDSTEA